MFSENDLLYCFERFKALLETHESFVTKQTLVVKETDETCNLIKGQELEDNHLSFIAKLFDETKEFDYDATSDADEDKDEEVSGEDIGSKEEEELKDDNN